MHIYTTFLKFKREAQTFLIKNKLMVKNYFLTFGREALDPELCVVIVRTVVIPSATLAGAASMLIQKETQDKMTISRLGMYIWIK